MKGADTALKIWCYPVSCNLKGKFKKLKHLCYYMLKYPSQCFWAGLLLVMETGISITHLDEIILAFKKELSDCSLIICKGDQEGCNIFRSILALSWKEKNCLDFLKYNRRLHYPTCFARRMYYLHVFLLPSMNLSALLNLYWKKRVEARGQLFIDHCIIDKLTRDN